MSRSHVRAVAIPEDSGLPGQLPHTDFADAYQVRLLVGASTDPQVWARRLFSAPPRGWVGSAVRARDRLVGMVGLKTVDRSSGMVFPELARTENEVILGLDDRHLDFRVGVHVEQLDHAVQVTVATVVEFHNVLGRLYFLPVRPVHPLVVRTILRRAAAPAAAA